MRCSYYGISRLHKGSLHKESKSEPNKWKERRFVLSETSLYYFHDKKSLSKGNIFLSPTTKVNFIDLDRYIFSVESDSYKVLILQASDREKMEKWITLLNEVRTRKPPEPKCAKDRLTKATKLISFMTEEENTNPYWSTPGCYFSFVSFEPEDMPFTQAKLQIATSASLQKVMLHKYGAGPNFAYFLTESFYEMGVPEEEISNLNEFKQYLEPKVLGKNGEDREKINEKVRKRKGRGKGTRREHINILNASNIQKKLGAWMDLSVKSAKQGIDFGWYFPGEWPIYTAIEMADPGFASRKVLEWTETHDITTCISFGRSMRSRDRVPGTSTEIRFKLPGNYKTQLFIALNAFSFFEFPNVPKDVVEILEVAEPEDSSTDPLQLKVGMGTYGFAKISIFVPFPSPELVKAFLGLVHDFGDEQLSILTKIEKTVTSKGPSFVEYQFLGEGFGINIFQEGFDVMFHYNVEDPE